MTGDGSPADRLKVRFAAVVRDVRHALAFYETARMPHMRADLQARFADTEAAYAFTTLSSAALFQATLCVTRLWEPSHRPDDTASLSEIARDLADPDTLDELAAASRERVMRREQRWRDQNPEALHSNRFLRGLSDREMRDAEAQFFDACERLSRLRDRYCSLGDDRLRCRYERLKAYRDKRLAHRNPFIARHPKDVAMAEVKDVTVLLGAACYLVSELSPLIDGSLLALRSERRSTRMSAEAFWNIPLRSIWRSDG